MSDILTDCFLSGHKQKQCSPLHSEFEIVAGLNNVILCVLMPKVEHLDVIDSDDSIPCLQACLLRWASAIHLQQTFASITAHKRNEQRQN